MKLVKIAIYVLMLLVGIGATVVTHLSGHIWYFPIVVAAIGAFGLVDALGEDGSL